MEVLTIQPQTDAQLKAIKAVLEALEIPFELSAKDNIPSSHEINFSKTDSEEDLHYNPEFVAKIKRSEKQVQNGEVKIIGLEDLWK